MRTFQVVIGPVQHKLGVETALRFAFIRVVRLGQRFNIGHVEIIFAMLNFAFQQDVAIGNLCAVIDVPDAVFILQGQNDAVEAVGDFDTDRIEIETAGLLEVGKLRDFLTVEPDFPAETPRAERRAFPVVLDEADVVLTRIDANCFQTAQVHGLRVAGIGFEDDLQLVVHLHSVGVVAKTPVVRADAGFDIDDVPRLRAENAQRRSRVHRACTDLNVVRLLDEAALRLPVVEQFEYGFLKAKIFSHVMVCLQKLPTADYNMAPIQLKPVTSYSKADMTIVRINADKVSLWPVEKNTTLLVAIILAGSSHSKSHEIVSMWS